MLLLTICLQLAAAQMPATPAAPKAAAEAPAPPDVATVLSTNELGEYGLFKTPQPTGSTHLPTNGGSATASVGGGGRDGGGDKWVGSPPPPPPLSSPYRGAKIVIPEGARFHYVRDDHFTRLGRDPKRILEARQFGPFGPAAIVNVRKNAAYDFFVGCSSGLKEELVSFDGTSSVKLVNLACR